MAGRRNLANMRNVKLNAKNRRQGGSTVLELAMMSIFVVALTIFAVDVSVLMVAVNVADRAAKDAARAAAQAGDSDTAKSMAKAALKAHPTDGTLLTTPEFQAASFEYQDFGGAPSDSQAPYVTVATKVQARVPAPIALFGTAMGADGTLTFVRAYTYPILKLKAS
jgi:Flp pilus assembly protein TadG